MPASLPLKHWLHLGALHFGGSSLAVRPVLTNELSLSCVVHSRWSLYFTRGWPFASENCPFLWGDMNLRLIHSSLNPCESAYLKQHLDQFSSFLQFTSMTTQMHRSHCETSVAIGQYAPVLCGAAWKLIVVLLTRWMIAGALSWNADLLASGSRDRMIMLHDTRIVPVVPEKRLAGHRQEVCQPVTQPVTILPASYLQSSHLCCPVQ